MGSLWLCRKNEALIILSDKKIPLRLLKDPRCLLAFGFGSGCASKAPGTFGTLAAIPFYLLISDFAPLHYLLVCLGSFVVGCYLCDIASQKLQVHDHGGIVWDEFVGYWIAMFAAPSGWQWVLIGFVLFRLFDIWKPWPIRILDKHVHGGFGIMIDDVVAGLYALGCLHLIAVAVSGF